LALMRRLPFGASAFGWGTNLPVSSNSSSGLYLRISVFKDFQMAEFIAISLIGI
jgi:hypothetical protein